MSNEEGDGCFLQFLYIIFVSVCLFFWYNIFCNVPNNYEYTKNRYKLPEKIVVIKTTLPFSINEYGEKIVYTKDINFSKDFKIKTSRYRLVKDDDWLPSRLIGHTLSVFRKIFFWDADVSWGLDKERSRAVLAMLESNRNITDITVRINHNEAIYDWWRMITDKKLRKRNPWLYRWTFGTLTAVKDELLAELSRGDYYNPLTKTAVVYSNVESVAAHELGHHVDFSRFSTDWLYSLSRILPPIMVSQEWKASVNATDMMISGDEWQFNRYLMPAFFTYVLVAIAITLKIIVFLLRFFR